MQQNIYKRWKESILTKTEEEKKIMWPMNFDDAFEKQITTNSQP